MKRLAFRAAVVRASGINDDEFVPSPCVAICEMDADLRMCVGCLRTLDELRLWSTLDNAGKRAVWQRIETRLPSNPAPL